MGAFRYTYHSRQWTISTESEVTTAPVHKPGFNLLNASIGSLSHSLLATVLDTAAPDSWISQRQDVFQLLGLHPECSDLGLSPFRGLCMYRDCIVSSTMYKRPYACRSIPAWNFS